ncbi:charged multivesicular body protein 6 [Exaiptasia diaphana]|uniref:Charged multivesicular body protein 6 n=1 Tax=Exaiptasia diaphana TaxID=2652724 RepID=A0A913X7Y2_EXADI|nr:charged multivesicular body protein 6 [Exaiptasia diaphana]KXJ28552.1 Charged multivesicular body protein 6 [Exaiptasia diaphana]
MGSLFSRKKEPAKPEITEQDKAVLALKQQRDKLKKYQKKIEQNLEKERQLAKELLQQGKKNKAKLLLKKKRYQEQLLERTDNQLENLEKMTQDIEFAQVQIQVAEGLKKGNECLHQLHEIMSIEEVERIMDETKEAVEYQKEIDDLLSGGLSDEDNDAVLKELEELQDAVGEKLPEVPKNDLEINLPEAPTQEPAEKKTKTETKEREMVAA